jgi:deoxyadenosine/deoxycytidine kinase
MPVICFEGASAIGKTTTANTLKARYGALVVPEVNLLFNRPVNESAEWYFERQVDRWSAAQDQSKTHHLVILDGDPFQPLWYNWSYNFKGWQDLDFMEHFYQPKIQNKTIDFPDLYFVFSTSEAELKKRKESDTTRLRRGFETHLKMIEPQRRYFRAMQTFSPSRVLVLEADSIETNIEFVLKGVSVLSKPNASESKVLFSRLIQWLRENKA